MKKILQLAAALLLSFSSTESKAQLADGSTASNFTFTDMNGNTQDLYTYLNAGKAVVIDISATWCGPCWNYHNSGNLENFYNQYGPSGSNVAMVLFIEGDGTTTNADMNGTGTNTQGNWVSGTPYPMCNPSSPAIDNFNTAYNIAYFPTMYLICPDKKTTDIDQYTTAQIVAAMNAQCPAATAGLDAGVSLIANPNSTICSTSFTPSVTLKNFGTTTLTSCTINYYIDSQSPLTQAWTGSLATGQTAVVTLPSMTTSSGSHTFTSSTSNPNGSADANTGNDKSTSSFNVSTVAANLPLQEGFESSSALPTGWNLVSADNTYNWVVSTSVGGFSGSTHSMAFDNCSPATDITGNKYRFITVPYDFSNATTANMTFDVASAQLNYQSTTYSDGLAVYASTDCGTTWNQIYLKSGAALATAPALTAVAPTCFVPTSTQWRTETVSLNSLVGQSGVMFAFEDQSGWAEWLYVDNINITAATSVNEINLNNYVSVYPNPSSGNFSLDVNGNEFGQIDVKIYNVLGEVISSINDNVSTPKKYNFDLSTQPNGMYFIEVKTNNGKAIKKIMLNK